MRALLPIGLTMLLIGCGKEDVSESHLRTDRKEAYVQSGDDSTAQLADDEGRPPIALIYSTRGIVWIPRYRELGRRASDAKIIGSVTPYLSGTGIVHTTVATLSADSSGCEVGEVDAGWWTGLYRKYEISVKKVDLSYADGKFQRDQKTYYLNIDEFKCTIPYVGTTKNLDVTFLGNQNVNLTISGSNIAYFDTTDYLGNKRIMELTKK